MNGKLARLAERRRLLVARVAAQRVILAQDIEPWRARLALADRGVAAFQYVRRHPALMLGGALLLAMFRPRRAGKWLQRGWLVWQFGRGLRAGGCTASGQARHAAKRC
jgi:hypothetical protein